MENAHYLMKSREFVDCLFGVNIETIEYYKIKMSTIAKMIRSVDARTDNIFREYSAIFDGNLLSSESMILLIEYYEDPFLHHLFGLQ